MHHDIPSIFVAAASAAAITLAGFLVAPFDGPWQMPSGWAWGLMTMSAACLFVANTAIIMALRTGEMSVIAPFRYVMVPMSILLGYWFWGDIPDALASTGIGLVLAAGLYTLHRERTGLDGKARSPRHSAARRSDHEAQSHEGEARPRRAGARLLGDVSLPADRGDAGLRRLRLGADRLRARQHRLGRRGADGDGMRRRRHHADRAAEDQLGERHPERHGPRRDGRAGAAYQHGRGRAPGRGVGQVRTRRRARAWRPAPVPTAWGLGARMPDFAHQANAQSLVCVQLEHEAALRNIDAILAVEGIDVFFIGPSDLSQSMGYPGNPKAPPVAKAIEEALAKHRRRRPHARHAGHARHACRGAGQRVPLHLHAPAAPPRHRRLGIPEAVAPRLARPGIHVVYDFGLCIAAGIPSDLDTTPGRALKCRHRLDPDECGKKQEDPWRRRQASAGSHRTP